MTWFAGNPANIRLLDLTARNPAFTSSCEADRQ